MAKRNKSALKANRQNIVRREANRQLRSKLRTGLKKIRLAVDGTDKAAATARGKSMLVTAAAIVSGVSTSTLPASHRSASIINGGPCSGGCWVHVATAVSRKPAMTAVAKPNSIS